MFHGFDAGKPRHIYIRGFFDLYCTTGAARHAGVRSEGARARALRRARNGLAEARSVHARARRRRSRRRVRAPAGDPVSLDVLAFVERGADPLRDDPRPVAQRPLALDRDAASEDASRETVARYRALEGEHLRFATEDNILDLFPQVDMMISDTSSALNEFLLTYKPVVTFKNRRPGPQLIDIDSPEQLLPSIERALARPPELMARDPRATPTRSIRTATAARASACSTRSTSSSPRGARNPRRKPRNWWRKLKIRTPHRLLGTGLIRCDVSARRRIRHDRRNQSADLAGRADRQDHDPRDQVRAHDRCREARERAHRAGAAAGDLARVRLRGAATSTREWAALRDINEKLWDIEDRSATRSAHRTFDQEFIELARAVYVTNDERAAVKRRDQHQARLEDRRREELREVLVHALQGSGWQLTVGGQLETLSARFAGVAYAPRAGAISCSPRRRDRRLSDRTGEYDRSGVVQRSDSDAPTRAKPRRVWRTARAARPAQGSSRLPRVVKLTACSVWPEGKL